MRWFISDAAIRLTDLAADVEGTFTELTREGVEDRDYPVSGSVCMLASEIIRAGRSGLPQWIDQETTFLVIRDVPVAASMRLPTLLRLHKPDQRLFLSDDSSSVRRWMIAPFRRDPLSGVIDAYLIEGSLTILLGDFSIRAFPIDRIPSLKNTPSAQLDGFEIEIDGSYLAWREADVHLSPSQLLQAVDPSHLADVEIERHRSENMAAALKHMRERRGLRQADISGLSERQVSRLENSRSRLTADAAEKLADAFQLELTDFLDEIGRLVAYWRELAEAKDKGKVTDQSAAVT